MTEQLTREMHRSRVHLGVDVLTETRRRIAWVFEEFPAVYVSFSAGKDSTVMLHLVADEARRRGRRFGILLIDLEAQYAETMRHAEEMFRELDDIADPYWVALPIVLRNAVSQFQPRWLCWDPAHRDIWVREPPDFAVTTSRRFPFYRHAMEFEEFVPEFGHWYSRGRECACLVGIRSQESLNRWRTLASVSKVSYQNKSWTTWLGDGLVNVYPMSDWRTEDIWTYHGKTGRPYNRIYDLMNKAGVSIHQQRICQPYGDDQRRGLWLFHLLEPSTWPRVVRRVSGANTGAQYAHQTGSMSGLIKFDLPPGHTWESFSRMLLESMPPNPREHYEGKIATFLQWWKSHGVDPIPDEAPAKEEAARRAPSWRRIAKTLLKNDWWCKTLSFSQQKSDAHERYVKILKMRRARWGI